MLNIFYFMEEIIDKNLEDLKFCKKFLVYQYGITKNCTGYDYEAFNNFKVKIEEIIDKIEDFFGELEEAGKSLEQEYD